MFESFFTWLSSLKISVLVVLAICVVSVVSSSNRIYAYGMITTEAYKSGLAGCVGGNGDLNAECSGSLFNGIWFTWANCALTSYDDNGTNGSGYCPNNLKAYNGLIPSLARATNLFYETPPANLAVWIKDTGQTLGFFPKTAYAQATGFTGLAPLLNIWKVFRNIAYILLSIAIIIVGFMIMFRRKIDPQTVVTIQEALPRIIIALILITFSYAIAALFIDLMYVTLLIAYQLFVASGAIDGAAQIEGSKINILGLPPAQIRPLLDIVLSGDLREAYYAVFPGAIGDLFTMASQFFNTSGGVFDISSLIGGVIGGFLLNVLVVILFIRLFFLFLGAYIQIILQIIFGPLYILSDVIPGNNNIGGWIKNIVANLAVFVIAGLLFMLTIVFNVQANAANEQLWVPPYTMIGSSISSVSILFSIGILLMLPNIVNQFRQSIKSAGGPGLGGAFSVGPVAGMATWGFHFLQGRQYHQQGENIQKTLGQLKKEKGLEGVLSGGKEGH